MNLFLKKLCPAFFSVCFPALFPIFALMLLGSCSSNSQSAQGPGEKPPVGEDELNLVDTTFVPFASQHTDLPLVPSKCISRKAHPRFKFAQNDDAITIDGDSSEWDSDAHVFKIVEGDSSGISIKGLGDDGILITYEASAKDDLYIKAGGVYKDENAINHSVLFNWLFADLFNETIDESNRDPAKPDEHRSFEYVIHDKEIAKLFLLPNFYIEIGVSDLPHQKAMQYFSNVLSQEQSFLKGYQCIDWQEKQDRDTVNLWHDQNLTNDVDIYAGRLLSLLNSFDKFYGIERKGGALTAVLIKDRLPLNSYDLESNKVDSPYLIKVDETVDPHISSLLNFSVKYLLTLASENVAFSDSHQRELWAAFLVQVYLFNIGGSYMVMPFLSVSLESLVSEKAIAMATVYALSFSKIVGDHNYIYPDAALDANLVLGNKVFSDEQAENIIATTKDHLRPFKGKLTELQEMSSDEIRRFIMQDQDSDGLPDFTEMVLGTNETKIDSNGDGVSDLGDLVHYGASSISTKAGDEQNSIFLVQDGLFSDWRQALGDKTHSHERSIKSDCPYSLKRYAAIIDEQFIALGAEITGGKNGENGDLVIETAINEFNKGQQLKLLGQGSGKGSMHLKISQLIGKKGNTLKTDTFNEFWGYMGIVQTAKGFEIAVPHYYFDNQSYFINADDAEIRIALYRQLPGQEKLELCDQSIWYTPLAAFTH